MAIKRVWRGWAKREDAPKYEKLARETIFPEIAAKNISGYRGIELMQRDIGDEVEFVTIMTFDQIKNIREFLGEEYTRSYVPTAVQEILLRWDTTAVHYEVC